MVLAGALLAVAFGLVAAPRLGRSGGVLLVALVLLVAWTGATTWWSIVPDRSWDAFNKSAAFAVFLGLGIVLAGVGGRVAARLGASVLAVVTAAVLAWALVAKSIPSLDPGGDRVARLREPVEYWNALALIADIAIGLGLWLGASRGHHAGARAAGGALVYIATLSLLLTLSRVGVAAAVAVVLLWLALSSERARRGWASARRVGDSGGARRRLGIHAAGARGRRRRAVRSRRGRRSPRLPDAHRRRARRRARGRGLARLARGSTQEEDRPGASRGRGARRRRRARRRSGRGRECGHFRHVLRRGRERSEQARLTRSEQPLVLVERGGRRVRGQRARGRGRRHVRDRAEALPLGCAERHAAAQRAVAAAGRGRARRARAVRRVRRRRGSRVLRARCAGSTEASALPPSRSSLRPSRISCTRSSTTTGTSSP